mgnify:FL=1
MNYNQYSSDQENSENESQSSRMSRVGGIFKQAKSIYLPTLSLTAKQLATEASTSLKSLYSTHSNLDREYQNASDEINANKLIQENQQMFYNNGNTDINYGNNLNPDTIDLSDLKITIYNSYTYYDKITDSYITEIKGNVCLYNNISRKNRWIYSGLKKMIIGSNKEEILINDDLKKLESIEDEKDYEKVKSNIKKHQLHTTDSKSSSQDHTIFDSRIYPFLNKGVAAFPLILQLNNIGVEHTLTKGNGDFLFKFVTKEDISKYKKENILTLKTNLKPQSIILSRQQEIQINENPNNSSKSNEFKDFTVDIDLFHYSRNNQIAIISDIDDTIKFTGVVESKNVILNTTFNKSIDSWLLPAMANWYKLMSYKYNVEVFYVSNSPQQLYPSLRTYVDKYFPSGIIVLKEYFQSNIFSNFLGSSAKKKMDRILRIIDHFPYKKYILIGDSGESDLEAYLEITKLRPNNIIGIYIRAVKGSMSDTLSKETKIVNDLNALIKEKCYSKTESIEDFNSTSPPTLPPRSMRGVPPIPPPPRKRTVPLETSSISTDTSTTGDLIDLVDKPKLPVRPVVNTDLKDLARPPNSPTYKLNASNANISRVTDLNPYNTYAPSRSLESIIDIDKKADNWRYRITSGMLVLRSLERSGEKIDMKFFQDDNIEGSCELVETWKSKLSK